MTLLLVGQVLQRELAPDLEPPPAWNEKQRLLTMLVEPVTRTEVRCPSAHRRGSCSACVLKRWV